MLRPYLQHVKSVADEMEQRRRELRLFANIGADGATGAPRWASAPFTHPATLDAVAMDPDLKARVRADLENFLKGRAYYHRLGRVWRRSYLLYGPPGTGKSTFAVAMARFLGYDVYDVDLSRAGGDDLRTLLRHTTPAVAHPRRGPGPVPAAGRRGRRDEGAELHGRRRVVLRRGRLGQGRHTGGGARAGMGEP